MNLLRSKVKLKLLHDAKNECYDVCVGALSVNCGLSCISRLGHAVVIIVPRLTVGLLINGTVISGR